MKIGLSCLAYECEQWLEKSLEPWLARNDAKISIIHGVFPEVHALGKPIHGQDNTISILENLHQLGKVDFVTCPQPMREHELRNDTLEVVRDCELLFLLDPQDEIYSQKDIDNILEFVDKNPFIDTFRINFKNLVGPKGQFIRGFNPKRIWRIKKNSLNNNIGSYYWDNDYQFGNGKKDEECSILTIPEKVAFIEHHSWDYNENEPKSIDRIKAKVSFQRAHYFSCSYKWENNTLCFDEQYFYKLGQTIPMLYSD